VKIGFLIPDLETKGSAREEFVQKIRSLLNREAANKEDASNIFFRVDAEDIMEQLRISEEDAETEIVSGGGATFLGRAIRLPAPAAQLVSVTFSKALRPPR
jgi:1,6-anhydro-N-acetylmuramate kinase